MSGVRQDGTSQLLRAPLRCAVVCVKFSKLVMVGVRWFIEGHPEEHPFVRSEMTIPSSRPALWQSAARSGSQGCRRDCGGTGGAGAQRPWPSEHGARL